MNKEILLDTVNRLATNGKGILAADESEKTIQKRFSAIGLFSTEESRKAYRQMLFTTPNLNKYISGIILFEETLFQKYIDQFLPTLLLERNILPGIKVDKGFIPLPNFIDDNITEGLDGLEQRLEQYKQFGVKFAKWRAVFSIRDAKNPSYIAIQANAEALARYSATCQSCNLVPIVEPEILIDGNHTIENCAKTSLKVFHAVFHALHKYKVYLEGIVLKPSMIISGKDCSQKSNNIDVAKYTLDVLLETIPAAVPTINFLSGGQTPEEATRNLNSINTLAKSSKPWNISFSYARALQQYALNKWLGKEENIYVAQNELLKRAKLNSLASLGKYESEMENEPS